MESTLSTINAMPSNLSQLEMFAEKTINEVKAGNVNALDLKIKLKWIEKAIELIDNGTKDEQLLEHAKHGKACSVGGFKIEQVESGTKYDYSSCNDLEWTTLKRVADKSAEAVKEREKFLKSLSRPTVITDDFTGGESIEILSAS
jgi:hypothetical protein